MYYVYKLIDPRTNSPFYVGKGIRNRIDQHEVEARSGRVSRKCDLIRDIESEGLSVVKRKVSFFASEVDAYLAEYDLIKSIGLANLTNILPGGGSVRSGKGMANDRQLVDAFANMISRTKAGEIRYVSILGQRLDLKSAIDKGMQKIASVALERGKDWVNEITARYNVQVEFE